jgi:hypothetical protein
MKVSLTTLFTGTEYAISNENWTLLKEIVIFLKPFSEATVYLSGEDYPTLSSASFILQGLVDHCANSIPPSLEQNYNRVKEKFEKYTPKIQEQALLPSLMDPRFKTSVLVTNPAAFGILKDTFVKYGGDLVAPQRELTWLEKLEKKIQNVDVNFVQGEIKLYLESLPTSLNSNPLTWWKENSMKFPVLSRVAADYLSILASSVPSERAFSNAGNFVSERRCNLLPESIESLMITRARILALKNKENLSTSTASSISTTSTSSTASSISTTSTSNSSSSSKKKRKSME